MRHRRARSLVIVIACAVVLAAFEATPSASAAQLLPVAGHQTPQAATATNWSQYGFDPQHTSFNPAESLLGPATVPSLALAWTAGLPCSIYSSPAVVDGTVYAGSYCGDFHAFDAATGQVRWTQSFTTIVTSPAVANGVVYVGDKIIGRLYALDAATGAPRWTATTGAGFFDRDSPTVTNGVVYVGSTDGQLHAFNAATGATIWTAATGGQISSAPAVSNGLVYVGSADATLSAFDSSTGGLVWTGATGGPINSSPAVANGAVFIGADDGNLYAFNAVGCGSPTCAPLWTANVSAGGSPAVLSPAVANGLVYVGGYPFTGGKGAGRGSAGRRAVRSRRR